MTNRFKFRLWLELESINELIHKAIDTGNAEEAISQIYQYVSMTFDDSIENINSLDWKTVIELFYDAIESSQLQIDIPMFMVKRNPNNKNQSSVSWEYPGRSWYSIAYIFSKEFGWSLEYIANLDVVEALKMLQEIQVSSQLDKEWDWLLSDKSITYDDNIKKSKFVPLSRPEWMQQPINVKSIDAREIPENMIPKGNVMRFENGKFVSSS